MLVAALVGVDMRSTVEMDATIKAYDLLLEDRSIYILAYNIETVIAEKLETIISRSIVNTRLRDFYDIYILLKVQGHNINKDLLTEAIIATSERRGSSNMLQEGDLILEEIFSSDILYSHWTRYQKKYSYANDISWDEIKESVFVIWNSLDISLKK